MYYKERGANYMRVADKIHNKKEDIKIVLIKYAYIFTPLIGLITYSILMNFIEIKLDENYLSNLINISGILAGFLFTSLGIMISLPDNKFTQLLKQIGYMRIIYNAITVGIIFFLIAMILGLFNISTTVANLFFIVGISETFLSSYYLYRVSYYSGKSK